MRKTRLSLYYLAGYLLFGGIGLLAAPPKGPASGDYSSALARLAGVLLLALGILIAQIIRHDLNVLYWTTLIVRAIILVVLGSLYIASKDPLFLVLLSIVGFGFLLTASCYILDWGRQNGSTPST